MSIFRFFRRKRYVIPTGEENGYCVPQIWLDERERDRDREPLIKYEPLKWHERLFNFIGRRY